MALDSSDFALLFDFGFFKELIIVININGFIFIKKLKLNKQFI